VSGGKSSALSATLASQKHWAVPERFSIGVPRSLTDGM
jgi:hypothetical protein